MGQSALLAVLTGVHHYQETFLDNSREYDIYPDAGLAFHFDDGDVLDEIIISTVTSETRATD
jgi:hypothetical protein